MKQSVRTPRHSRAAQPKARMGIPTVKQRLDMINRAVIMAAAGLGVDADTLSNTHPKVRAVSLNAAEVAMIAQLLNAAAEHTFHIMENVSADVLAMLAATYDQRQAFEPIELIGGAR